MKKFRYGRPVEAAQGTQWFTVEAESRAEADAKAKRGEMQYEDEEVEVTELGKPEFVEEVAGSEGYPVVTHLSFKEVAK